jgi:2-oxoglutarate dehydrogenase E2 component (dihydrolipoamide succinyltransferase)
MKHPVKAPSVGESITEVSILRWAKPDGAQVKTGELLLEIESDKATVEIVAEATGALSISKPAGERIPIGEVVGIIDDAVQGSVSAAPSASPQPPGASQISSPVAPSPAGGASGGFDKMGPAARKLATEQGTDVHSISGSGKDGRVTKGDLLASPQRTAVAASVGGAQVPQANPTNLAPSSAPLKPGERRVPMTLLRQKIAERLLLSQSTNAILTTFNEVDMSKVMALRTQNKEAFKAKHGVNLGFMSFFTRACVEALKVVPEVNAWIDGRDILYHDYFDIGVAVGTDRGLVVPVVRNAQNLSFGEIEKTIAGLAVKARDGKLSIAEMSGGTFTISNGGVYGSLMSTPILNPPQSGIFGMHKIMDRPIAVDGQVVIRPMMYIALSYDHRLIDGKQSVTFLVTVKDFMENPEKLGAVL